MQKHAISSKSQQYSSNPGAGFGIGESVVMINQIIATSLCNRMKLVVGKPIAKMPS